MSRTCGTCEEKEKGVQNFDRETLKERDHVQDWGIDEILY
jgi:hypothetical protein